MENTRNKPNGIRLLIGSILVFFSIPFFMKSFDYIGYGFAFIGSSLVIYSQYVFFKNVSMETLKSKAFLWTLIPTLICIVLNKLSKYFLFSDMETSALIVYALSIIIALITVVQNNFKGAIFLVLIVSLE